MTPWPFKHDWASTYNVTLSYKTDILVSRSGQEQRRAMRYEPRRTLETSVTADMRQMREFDRFLWVAKQQTFTHTDPVDGAVRTVRLPVSQSITHKTSGVSEVTIDLAVEPGTETFDTPPPDASYSYALRYVFPLSVNWRDGVTDLYSDSRQTLDFDRGRISVALPVPFSTRQAQVSTLIEDETVSAFFRAMRGRQGEFWSLGATDDLLAIGVSGTTLIVEGDVASLYAADTVHRVVFVEFPSGGRYLRTVLDAAIVGTSTYLQLNYDFPEDTLPRRATWAFLTRFASDDFTVQWTTTKVGQSSIQLMTLPSEPVENPLPLDEGEQYLVDYYGLNFLFADILDYVVNIQIPRLSGDVTTRQWFEDGMQAVVDRML